MRLAIAQINPTIGALEANRKLVERAVDDAVDAGADLVALPEMALTGYPPMDLLERDGFVRDQLRELETLAKASKRVFTSGSGASPGSQTKTSSTSAA